MAKQITVKDKKFDSVLSVNLSDEQLRFIDDMAREFEGNRSMAVRRLIDMEMERRLEA